jgi:ABC-2 type transport system ATP-binding protein
MNAIEVQGLRKTYANGVQAVKGIDFAVAEGEVFGLLGPNGAGKSTTVGMLATTVRPSAGSARLAGHDVETEPLQARACSSVVFQEAVVDGALSGRENLELHARLWRVEPTQGAKRIADLAAALGISELLERRAETYSGGQRRRLEIARALVSAPRVLFLDEPTVGLDPLIRQELLEVIAGLRAREEVTILLTTHYLDEAERLTDRVAIFDHGEIVALDTPAALLGSLGAEILELRVGAAADTALGLLRAEGVAGADAYSVGGRLAVPLHERGATATLQAIEATGLRTEEIALRRPTLDDVYIHLTGGLRDAA